MDSRPQRKRRGDQLDFMIAFGVTVDVFQEISPGAAAKIRKRRMGDPGGGVFIFGHEITIAVGFVYLGI